MARFAVIGLGKFGFHLACTLAEEGQSVLCLDRDEALVSAVSELVDEAVVGDATRKELLKELGVAEAEKVVVAIGDLSASVLITLYLRELGARFILAKALDEDHARILSLVGADQVVIPEKEAAIREAKALVTPNIVDFLPLLPDFSVARVDPPAEFVGQSLKELELRRKFHVYVIAVRNKNTDRLLVLPPAEYNIEKDDELFLLGRKEYLSRFTRS